jgi:hypothetical protein
MTTPASRARPAVLKLFAAATGAALLVLVAAGVLLAGPAMATHRPADKTAVSGSTVEFMTAQLVEGASSEVVTLLTGTMRASSPTDLLFRVTAECALWTNVTTVGGDDSGDALASVTVWVTIDGVTVPVSGDDTVDAGQVVFCNRTHHMSVMDLDDEDAEFNQFLRTREASAFQWLSLNVGNGVHRFEVKGQLDAQVTGTGEARAAVGKRTLVAEPVKLANDASV